MSNKREGTIEERVRAIICDELAVDEADVTPNASLEYDLGGDSLDRAEVIFACEDEFEIEISDEDAEGLTNVAKIVAIVEQLTN